MKTGSSNKLEEIETEIGSCLPIQVVVFVSFNCSEDTHIDSKSKTAKFLNNFRSSLYEIPNPSNLSNKVSRNVCTLFE